MSQETLINEDEKIINETENQIIQNPNENLENSFISKKIIRSVFLAIGIILLSCLCGFSIWSFIYANQVVQDDEIYIKHPWYLEKNSLNISPHLISFKLNNMLTTPDPDIFIGRYNSKIQKLNGKIISINPTLTQIILDDHLNSRWNPENLAPLPNEDEQNFRKMENKIFAEKGFEFDYNPFSIRLNYENKIIFSTSGETLKYFDKYIEINAILTGNNIFGIGPRMDSFLLEQNKKYKIYAGGSDSEESNQFLIIQIDFNKFFGLYAFNSNGQSIEIETYNNEKNKILLKQIFIGGIVNLFFISPGTFEQVCSTYINLIGKPKIPEFFSYGLSYDIYNADKTLDYQKLIDFHDKNSIPLDTIWGDENIMFLNRSFSLDKEKFGNLGEFIEKNLHQNYRKFIIKINPYISVKDNLYELGQNFSIFIKKSNLHENSIIPTNCGLAAFLDPLSPNILQFYLHALNNLSENLLFDGIWLNNNDISTKIQNGNSDFYRENPNSDFRHFLNNPIGNTIYKNDSLKLDDTMLKNSIPHYNFHNIYPLFSAKSLYFALNSSKFVQNIYSGASFSGTSHFSSVLLNNENLNSTLIRIFNGQILGNTQPTIIFDINNKNNGNLIRNWIKTGFLFPQIMLRIDKNSIDNNKELIENLKNSIFKRYALIQFMNTKEYFSNLLGIPCILPLWTKYENDTDLLSKNMINQGYLWGNEIYVLNSEFKEFYLPKNSQWFHFDDNFEGQEIIGEGKFIKIENKNEFLPVILQHQNTILTIQNNIDNIKNTHDLLYFSNKHEFLLSIYAPNKHAKGELILSDFSSKNAQNHYSFEFYPDNLTDLINFYILKIHRWNEIYEDKYKGFIRKVNILGKLLNGNEHCCVLYSNFTTEQFNLTKSQNLITLDMGKNIDFEEIQSIIFYIPASKIPSICQSKFSAQKISETNSELEFSLKNQGQNLFFNAKLFSETILKLQISDSKNTHSLQENYKKNFSEFGLSVGCDPFSFKIKNILTTENLQQFKIMPYYFNMKIKLEAKNLYGLAGIKNNEFLLLENKKYILWNTKENQGKYGLILLQKEKLGEFYGIVLDNKEPIEIKFSKVSENEILLDFAILSQNNMEFYIIKGTNYTIQNILNDYKTHFIGNPLRPIPVWFGGHFGKIYHETHEIEKDAKNKAYFIDFLHIGNSYNNPYIPYELNSRYENLAKISKEIKENYQTSLILSIPPWFSYRNNFTNLNEISIISSRNKKPLSGYGSPGKINYFSFTNSKSIQKYESIIQKMLENTNTFGFYLENNQLFNECDGECANLREITFRKKFLQDLVGFPLVFAPRELNIFKNTLSLDSYDSNKNYELNRHSENSYYQAGVVYNYTQNIKNMQKMLILSESSMQKTGNFAGTILNCNSIEEILLNIYNYQMSGMNFVGVDICKNNDIGKCKTELEISTFLPFSRLWNSTILHENDKELFSIYENSMKYRYKEIPYILYSYMNTLENGPQFIRPIFFDFPLEAYNSTKIMNHEFLLGKSLLVLIEQNSDKNLAFFPSGCWMDERNITNFYYGPTFINLTTSNKIYGIPQVFQKCGTLRISHFSINTTRHANRLEKIIPSPISLKVVVDSKGKSEGNFQNYLNSTNSENYTEYNVKYDKLKANFTKIKIPQNTKDSLLREIIISDNSYDLTKIAVIVVNCGENCEKKYLIGFPQYTNYIKAECVIWDCARLDEIISISLIPN